MSCGHFLTRWEPSRQLVPCVLLVVMLAWMTGHNRSCQAQLCGQLGGFNFTENFNTLASTGSSTTVPSEFSYVEAGAGGTLTYTADNGTLSTGNTYSYGATGSSDRALGELTASNVQSTIGACFTNNTNHAITSFIVGYTGEEWRRGQNGGTADRLDFQYSTDANSLSTGTYINVDSLDFNSPVLTPSGSKDGNAAANRDVLSPFAITPAAPIQPEATFYIRWNSVNISGANDGLAIDDFSIGTLLSPGIATDYNNDGKVNAADYIIWREFRNQAVTIPNDITPGTVTQQDFVEWKDRFGLTAFDLGAGAAVPEPAGLVLATLFAAVVWGGCRSVWA